MYLFSVKKHAPKVIFNIDSSWSLSLSLSLSLILNPDNLLIEKTSVLIEPCSSPLPFYKYCSYDLLQSAGRYIIRQLFPYWFFLLLFCKLFLSPALIFHTLETGFPSYQLFRNVNLNASPYSFL